MKNLVQYINEHNEFINEYCKLLDEINSEIIIESFSSSVFKELINQQQKFYEKWEEEDAAGNYNSRYNRPVNIYNIFKTTRIMWSKISDDDILEFDFTNGGNKEGEKLFKRICSNRSNSINGIILILIDNPDIKYSGLIIKDSFYISYYGLPVSSSREDLKPSQANDILKKIDKCLIIPLEDKKYYKDDLRGQRNNSRHGMIEPGNVEQYKRMAQENRERYKKLAAKLKIEKLGKNDDVPDKVMDCVNKVMDLSVEFAKNPSKYTGLSYEISKLIDLVGDKEVGYYDRGKYHKYGINGLMFYYSGYIQKKLKIASGDSGEYERKSYEDYRNKLLAVITKIKDALESINKTIQELENKE